MDTLRYGGIPPKLEELNILWLSRSLHHVDSDPENTMKVQLQQDDQTFASMYTSGGLPCLRRINITVVSMQFWGEGEDSSLPMRPQDFLPFIHGMGMLVVKSSSYNDEHHFMQHASIVARG